VDTEFTEEKSERDGDVHRVRGILCASDYVLRRRCVDKWRGRKFGEHIETFGVDVYDANFDRFGVSVASDFVSGVRTKEKSDAFVGRFRRIHVTFWHYLSFCQREFMVVELVFVVFVFFLRHV
jgi:hypothetical protein